MYSEVQVAKVFLEGSSKLNKFKHVWVTEGRGHVYGRTPVNKQTDKTENITFRQTTYAANKYDFFIWPVMQ